MKAEQVDEALKQKFLVENHRLVFWHDESREFADYITAHVEDGFDGELAKVQVLDVATMGGLLVKIKIEQEETSDPFLVYYSGGLPNADEDWLLDVRAYAGRFQADVASIWLQELGLTRLTLCDHLKQRTSFMRSTARRKSLVNLVQDDDTEQTLDLKMLAVLTGSPIATVFEVLMALCNSHEEDGSFALEAQPVILDDIAKKGLEESFWHFIADEFGYGSNGLEGEVSSNSIAGLMRCLLATELLTSMGSSENQTQGISAIEQFRLPSQFRRQISVFLTQWRDSASRAQSYDAVADAVSVDLGIPDLLSNVNWQSLLPVSTFLEIDKLIAAGLRNRVLEPVRPDQSAIQSVITQRSESHWLSGVNSSTGERAAIAAAFRSIGSAANLFDLLDKVSEWLLEDNPEALLKGYGELWYLVDQYYRRFYTEAAPAEVEGWNLLKSLTDEVERSYDQRFLQPLGVHWSKLLDDGFLQKWNADDLPPQQHFYRRNVAPVLSESSRRRVFVVISDALRFEAARELAGELSGQYRIDAEVEPMLGVLPSYTGLGMASLLPHKELSYNDRGDVLVDGASTAGIESRNTVLGSVKGIACKAENLLAMNQNNARDYVSDARVVYIYHNEIDAVGDSASTESDTFGAVTRGIEEITAVVRFCINRLNASKVLVTADHGFLYQVAPPTDTDRSKLLEKPANAVKHKKRYVVGRELGANANVHAGSTSITAGTTNSMDFWVPRGANRFHFTGGARFVHGGAMPQEVVVPLITVSEIDGKKKASTRIEKVGVQVLGAQHRITTPVYRFQFVQTEAVSERRKPVTVRIAVYENDQPVTSVEKLIFDSASDSTEERQRAVKLELLAGTFDKRTPYFLRVHDADKQTEITAIQVIIDRSFEDDF